MPFFGGALPFVKSHYHTVAASSTCCAPSCEGQHELQLERGASSDDAAFRNVFSHVGSQINDSEREERDTDEVVMFGREGISGVSWGAYDNSWLDRESEGASTPLLGAYTCLVMSQVGAGDSCLERQWSSLVCSLVVAGWWQRLSVGEAF